MLWMKERVEKFEKCSPPFFIIRLPSSISEVSTLPRNPREPLYDINQLPLINGRSQWPADRLIEIRYPPIQRIMQSVNIGPSLNLSSRRSLVSSFTTVFEHVCPSNVPFIRSVNFSRKGNSNFSRCCE